MSQYTKYISATAALIAVNILAFPALLIYIYSEASFTAFSITMMIFAMILSNLPVYLMFILAKQNNEKYFLWSVIPVFLTIAAYSFLLQFNLIGITIALIAIALIIATVIWTKK